MDDYIIQSLERLFYQKIVLYNDLLDCFKNERESLINIDLDKLWSISKEKEEICSKINSIQHEIISILNPEIDQKSFSPKHILHLIPGKDRAKFQKLDMTLLKLKAELEVLRKENMIFINDSLQFLDEMMSIIVGETKSQIMYNDRCHISKSGTKILLSREA